MTNPQMFKIELTEPTDTNTITAEYLDDKSGLKFNFDIDEFLKPKEERTIASITSPVDKIDAGFEPDSAWGVRFQSEVDAKIRNRMNAYMKAKFGMNDDS